MSYQERIRKSGMKDRVLISFSAGETSAYMAQHLWRSMKDVWDMVFVFANTGEENEESLVFANRFSEYYEIPIVWVEAVVDPRTRKGTKHKIVSFETASRHGDDGGPFESVIAKYGIPNITTPHCTRELKERPITSYGRSLWGKEYLTAIGIRADEADRINEKSKEIGLIYPLIQMRITKPMVNAFWESMPFRLPLKGYEGNCKWCWKKSLKKLYQIARENPARFNFPGRMEVKYGGFVPQERIKRMTAKGGVVPEKTTFFRGHKTVNDILNECHKNVDVVPDDARFYDYQMDLVGGDGESCEVFSGCNP